MTCIAKEYHLIPVYLCTLLQWAVLTRKHAKVVVEDETVFPMFQKYCKVMCYMVHFIDKLSIMSGVTNII